MNNPRQRPLSLDFLRAFEAVSRRLSFSGAAEELHLTQSAISRQIKGLEEDLGTPLFNRGTRKVELTAAGLTLQRSVLPLLERLDRTVREIRSRGARRQVAVTTFASFATLWLLPRLADFQQQHPDIDIRISALDRLVEPDDPDIDLMLRYGPPSVAPPQATRLFGEMLTPLASPRLLEQAAAGLAPRLAQPADLAQHTLIEEDSSQPSAASLSWQRWLDEQGLGGLQPRSWMYLNYTHQQVQAALAGQGVALARMALVHELLVRGELVEPFGPARRLSSASSYYRVTSLAAEPRPELDAFIAWIDVQAALTRRAIGEADAG